MNAEVISWHQNQDMPLGELNEAVMALIDTYQLDLERDGDDQLVIMKPKVYFTYPSYPHVMISRGGNQGPTSATGQGWLPLSLVVSDSLIDEEQADRIVAIYWEQLAEEDDATDATKTYARRFRELVNRRARLSNARDGGSSLGQLADASEEQDPAAPSEQGKDGGSTETSTSGT